MVQSQGKTKYTVWMPKYKPQFHICWTAPSPWLTPKFLMMRIVTTSPMVVLNPYLKPTSTNCVSSERSVSIPRNPSIDDFVALRIISNAMYTSHPAQWSEKLAPDKNLLSPFSEMTSLAIWCVNTKLPATVALFCHLINCLGTGHGIDVPRKYVCMFFEHTRERRLTGASGCCMAFGVPMVPMTNCFLLLK